VTGHPLGMGRIFDPPFGLGFGFPFAFRVLGALATVDAFLATGLVTAVFVALMEDLAAVLVLIWAAGLVGFV